MSIYAKKSLIQLLLSNNFNTEPPTRTHPKKKTALNNRD